MATPRPIQWSCDMSEGMVIQMTKLVECPVVDRVPFYDINYNSILKNNFFTSPSRRLVNWTVVAGRVRNFRLFAGAQPDLRHVVE